jgi:transposase-like protein
LNETKDKGNGAAPGKPRTSGVAGAERSEAEATPEVRRGRPGRRSAEERTQAVLDLLAGKATVDQLAFRYGVKPETVEGWRQAALEGVSASMRQGNHKSAREAALEKKLQGLERAFTDLAIRNEIAERALRDRPTRPAR